MSRDLAAYENAYELLPFEQIQLRYRKRKILESLTKYRPRRILEIGCGLDPLFMHYAEFDGFTVVEPANAFAQNARTLGEGRRGVSIVFGTLEENVELLNKGVYDFIVLSSLLHEVPNPDVLLASTKRLCKGDTVVHVNVPNAGSFHRLLALEMAIIKTIYEPSKTQQRMQQTHTFDVDSLASLVSKNGFLVVEQGTFFIKPFAHAQMEHLRESGFATDAMLDGLYSLSKHLPEHGSEIYMNLRVVG